MARIEGDIVINRPVEAVFDYVADQSNEPQYNPQMVRAEKITEGPGGIGTKFRSAGASMGRTAEMLIECTGYDRPRRPLGLSILDAHGTDSALLALAASLEQDGRTL
jgi:hypothetical protein